MPLPTPSKREHVNTRTIKFMGYRREDGLWDIEAELTDSRPYSFPNRDRGRIEAGEPLHHMLLRLSVDRNLEIHDIAVSTDASPFNYCPGITETYQQLIGKQIAPGWVKMVKKLFAREKGCTHITELLCAIGTPAIHTVFASKNADENVETRKTFNPGLNTCHALAEDSPVVKIHWPDSYTPKEIPTHE